MMRLIKKLLLRTVAVLIIILLNQHIVMGTTTPTPYQNPLRPPATNSPRATLSGFMRNMNEAYQLIQEAEEQSKKEGGLWHSRAVKEKGQKAEWALRRAVDTLNLVDIPPISRQDIGTEYALMLKEVLDRLKLPKGNNIPSRKDVEQEDLKRWEIPGTEIAIMLVEEGFNVNEFLFSPETVKRIRNFYQLTEKVPYYESNSWKTSPEFYNFYITTPGYLLPPKWNSWLPKWTSKLIRGQTIWQWFSLGVISSMLFFSILGVAFLLRQYINTTNEQKKAWLGLLLPTFTLWVGETWELLMDKSINITGQLLDNLLKLSTVIQGGVLAWLAFMVFNAIASTIISNMPADNKSLEAIIARNGIRILGVMAALTVFYTTSKQIGVAVGPIIASFGISSIAIGLGVKPYIENIVGGLTLFVNRPMNIGDFCELGGVTGTVEDIGLRSTLIRTVDRKLIYVPNTVVSTSQIVNHSQRDKHTFDTIISLSYDSIHERLAETMENLRVMLAQHPKLSEERISLDNLSNEVIDIDLFTYILTKDSDESIQIQEEILLKINEVLDLMGVEVVAISFRE
ncbi:mechanosensitive ion channel family protein [Dapis sp. BLCC M126]|uniref:mechanosensitive ion channel family protein n=1 Tax=Dapis sp. BLCC M126 TaxID=3400189 RepID=UPI003CEBC9E1